MSETRTPDATTRATLVAGMRDEKDSLGRSFGDNADKMTPDEAIAWLALIDLDGYRNSVKVALVKAVSLLAQPEARPDEVTAPRAPHIREDYQEVWQSGWRAGYRAASASGEAKERG